MATAKNTKQSAIIQASSAEQEILIAWRTYRRVEKYGLAFGKVCYKWQQELNKQGSRKGEPGLYAMLHKVGVPVRTAYWRIKRF